MDKKSVQKKIVKYMLGIMILLSVICRENIMEANADNVMKTYGHYTYVEMEDGAWIVGYNDGIKYTNESDVSWSVPATLNGLPVLGIGNYRGIEFQLNIRNHVSEIVLPDTLKYIGEAFNACINLRKIEMSSNLEGIGSYAFFNCSKLENIEIPKGVTYIETHAFNGCHSLKEINIPASVSRIGEYAFFDCWSATGIFVADGNENYFDLDGILCQITSHYDIDGDSIDVISYPGGKSGAFFVEENMYIQPTALVNAKALTSITVDVNNPWYSGEDGILYNKDKTILMMCPCAKTGTIQIPDGVTELGYSAFSYSNVEEIVMPDSVISVGYYAIYNCDSLRSITIGAGMINEGESYYSANRLIAMLEDAPRLAEISISSNNSYMKEEDGIVYNADMTKILLCAINRSGSYIMPDTVVSAPSTIFQYGYSEMKIGAAFEGSFYEYDDEGDVIDTIDTLKSFSVSELNKWYMSKDGIIYSKDMTSVENIPDAMSGTLIIPEGVTYIADGTAICNFKGTVTIPKSVAEINVYIDPDNPQVIINGYAGSYAEQFAKEYGLSFVKIEETQVVETKLPEVGTKIVVSGAEYKVTVSENMKKEVTYVKPVSKNKVSIKIPATIAIEGYAYKVTAVSNKAFKNNKKLKSVTIGKNISKIGKEAFCNCKKLSKITIKSTSLKSIGKNAIKNIKKTATIKAPKKKLSAYKKLFKSKTGYRSSMKIKK